MRTLAKPLLNLFHGERGCKRWKQAMDAALRVRAATREGMVLPSISSVFLCVLPPGRSERVCVCV